MYLDMLLLLQRQCSMHIIQGLSDQYYVPDFHIQADDAESTFIICSYSILY